MFTVIAGTNRPNSRTLKVANYYCRLLDQINCPNQLIDLSSLPADFTTSALYQQQGKNQDFNEFINKINKSNKLVFIIPEYNGSFPGVLKAFLDGLEYPNGIRNKKAGLIGLSAGSMGGALALSHFTDILNYLGVHVLASKPRLGGIDKIFDGTQVTDPFIRTLIEQHANMMQEF